MTTGASPFLQLLKLAKAPGRRAELMSKLIDVYVADKTRFNAKARAELDAVLTALIEIAPDDARRTAAARLAPVDDAPPALMRRLAGDAMEIAAPVLSHSRAVDRETLYRLAREGGDARRLLIARRSDCGPTLGALLAEHGNEATLIALAENLRARLDGKAMDALTEAARRRPALHTPMAARPDLPPLTLTRLYFCVAPPLRRDILMRAEIIEPALAAGAASANRESVLTDAGDRLDGARRRVRKALRAGSAPATLLCDLLRAGPASAAGRAGVSGAFLIAFAHYAGVEIDAARAMLGDRRCEALAVAARANDAPRPLFAKLMFGVGRLDEDDAQTARMLDLYMKIPRHGAERLMRFWRVRGRAASPGTASPDEARRESPLDLEAPRLRAAG